MRILMATRRFPPDAFSGTDTVFKALYEQARTKHEVRLVAGWQGGRDRIPTEAIGVKLAGLGVGNQWLAMAKAIRSEVKRWRPDVVLSNNIEVPPTGTPTVCVVHDLDFGEPGGRPVGRRFEGWMSRARRTAYGLRSRGLSRVVAVSETARMALLDAGVSDARITVVRNGVDTVRFSPQPRDGERETIRFLHPARVLPGKGQHLTIDAVARLPRLHKRRAELHIVGSVADSVYLDQVRVQAYNQSVQFHLDVPDMVPHLQEADVILCPSVMAEGFGLTAVEAMACGVPVIWADQPGIREATGGIGVSVPIGDVEALRGAMKALMDDPDERKRLGEAGREWVEQRYSWEGVWVQYEQVLANAKAV
ncbi:MAG: hypothetical protein CL930_06100 [Deltaproteobacteria bacterium]|nr:hypothetical protein [Deltaproteobacteria bacterium]